MEEDQNGRCEKYFGFKCETFADEVYNQSTDLLQEALDNLEIKLRNAAISCKNELDGKIEEDIQTCCDRIQRHGFNALDFNIDLFELYTRENIFFFPPDTNTDITADSSKFDEIVSKASGSSIGEVIHEDGADSAKQIDFFAAESAEHVLLCAGHASAEEELDLDLQRLRARIRRARRHCFALTRRKQELESLLCTVKEMASNIDESHSSLTSANQNEEFLKVIGTLKENSDELIKLQGKGEELNEKLNSALPMHAELPLKGENKKELFEFLNPPIITGGESDLKIVLEKLTGKK